MKLWISSAMSPYGNPYGVIAVVAETREEAIAKASAKLQIDGAGNYVPAQHYARNLLENLGSTMREVEDEVFIDWDPAEKRR